MARDWENLPAQLLDQVIDTLVSCSASDYHRFSSVCKTWYTIAAESYHKYKTKYGLIPHLLITTSEPNNHYLLNPVTKTMNSLSMPYNMRCSGSSYGWLAYADESDNSILLYNPYTKAKICLPPLINNTDPHVRDDGPDDPHPPYLLEYYFTKLILSANPTTHDDYVVAIIYGGMMNLAFIRAGDQEWTLTGLRFFYDIIFHKGLIYGSYGRDGMISINPDGDENFDRKYIKKPWTPSISAKRKYVGNFYLVESVDRQSLYKVIKVMKGNGQALGAITSKFTVSKMILDDNGKEKFKWLKSEKGLEGHTFFLGHNYSFAVLPSQYPAAKLSPNSIYFTDDYNSYRNLDYGVFHIKEQKLGESFYKTNNPRLPPAIWIEPSADFRST